MKNLRFRKIKGCIRRLHNQKKVGTTPGFKARAPDSKTPAGAGWVLPATALLCRDGKAVVTSGCGEFLFWFPPCLKKRGTFEKKAKGCQLALVCSDQTLLSVYRKGTSVGGHSWKDQRNMPPLTHTRTHTHTQTHTLTVTHSHTHTFIIRSYTYIHSHAHIHTHKNC